MQRSERSLKTKTTHHFRFHFSCITDNVSKTIFVEFCAIFGSLWIEIDIGELSQADQNPLIYSNFIIEVYLLFSTACFSQFQEQFGPCQGHLLDF